MKKFKLLTQEGYNPIRLKQGEIYTEDYIAIICSVKDLVKVFPEDWQEVCDKGTQLTESEKFVIIDFLNEYFDEFCHHINFSIDYSVYCKLSAGFSKEKVSNLIDKIEKL